MPADIGVLAEGGDAGGGGRRGGAAGSERRSRGSREAELWGAARRGGERRGAARRRRRGRGEWRVERTEASRGAVAPLFFPHFKIDTHFLFNGKRLERACAAWEW
jgi:hypothetical protein